MPLTQQNLADIRNYWGVADNDELRSKEIFFPIKLSLLRRLKNNSSLNWVTRKVENINNPATVNIIWESDEGLANSPNVEYHPLEANFLFPNDFPHLAARLAKDPLNNIIYLVNSNIRFPFGGGGTGGGPPYPASGTSL